ncbi:MAG: Rid family hydrolase [Planctomycetota bacterium]
MKWSVLVLGFACATVCGQPGLRAQTPQLAAPGSVVALLQKDAEALRPLFASPLVAAFLAATRSLPSVEPRKIYRDAARRYYSAAEFAQLADTSQISPIDIDEHRYYYTKYGSPLAYARALEIASQNGFTAHRGRRLLDFGYGTIGHLRLLAEMQVHVVGVDVDSFLTAIYSEPADVGPPSHPVQLIEGRFPADPAVVARVGDGYDLIISKNTLKRGYVHPERPADVSRLIDLGVADASFVRALYEALKPGGMVLIYNICPKQAPEPEPYIPWADGRSPFERCVWEAAGFRVAQFDVDDGAAVRAMAAALGWDKGESPMDLDRDLFAHYTVVVRPLLDHVPAVNALGPYSAAVWAGDTCYLSGQIGKVGGTFEEEAASALTNVEQVLARVGLTFSHVSSVTVYLTDMSNYAAFNRIYSERLGPPFPARTCVAVAALPANARLELQLTAHRF